VHFLQSKEKYTAGRALVFTNIDYLMLTYTLMRRDYAHLAKCFVPIGEEQIRMAQTPGAVEAMLRTKTKKFTEEDIRKKFPEMSHGAGAGAKKRDAGIQGVLSRLRAWLDGASKKTESLPLGAVTLDTSVPSGHRKAE
jgi:hypothetical protein